ncbi:Calx-beta domain-containing protein [Reyranella sp.]|uniref:Calx-beta domain-containing protein n=1 Tax=Reyranella sp. TaxID=1929291 RepID=UPI0037847B4A
MTWTDDLANDRIRDLAVQAAADAVVSYQEMLAMLEATVAGGITVSEHADLKLVYTNYAPLFASDYLKSISYSVIYSNPANAKWWGGVQKIADVAPLGDMAAGMTELNGERLIGKWFLGKDLPMAVVGGDTASGTAAKGVYSYATATGPLFVDGVAPTDINQGQAGDCYLMASLGAIADIDPSLIVSAFIDNGNGTWGVRFYLDGAPAYVTVDMSVPVKRGGTVPVASNETDSLAGEQWVTLFEKAYVDLNAQANIDNVLNWTGEKSYRAIENGWASPIRQVTNLGYTYYSSYYATIPDEFKTAEFVSADPLAYKQTIIDALAQGEIAWLATFGTTYDTAGKKNLVAGHAFVIMGYDAATDSFLLRNPWGASNATYNVELKVSIGEFWNPTVKGVVAISGPAEAPPAYAYTLTTIPSAEGEAVTFTVTRSGSGTPSTVYVSTVPGSAGTGDYAAVDKLPVEFAAYETVKTVKIDTYADNLADGTATFRLDLFPSATDAASTASATAAIDDVAADAYVYTITSSSGVAGSAVTEGGQVVFTITRTGSGSASTVYLATSGGTAGAGDVQGLANLALVFAAYETTKTISVATLQDSVAEGTESFHLDLYENLSTNTPSASAGGFIADAALPTYAYTVRSSAGSPADGIVEGGAVTFTIVRSGSGTKSEVFVATAGGSAGGADYSALALQPVSFSANQTVATVTVQTNEDWWLETDEFFTLGLFLNVTDSVHAAYGTGFIKDKPKLDYNYTVSTASEATPAVEGSPITFTIARDGSGTASTVYLGTTSATADGSDFRSIGMQTLTFAAYETSKTVTVDTFTDSLVEGTEYFWLDLYRNRADNSFSAYGKAQIKDAIAAGYDYSITSSAPVDGPASEGAPVTFTVTRSGSGSASTVWLSTVAGTATAGDYQGLDKAALTFAAYETAKTVSVDTFTDGVTEGSEYFWLDLFKAYGDATSATYASASIADTAVGDYGYTVTSNAPFDSPVGEGYAISFTVTRRGSGTASTVYVGTEAGTASAGSGDYQGIPGFALHFGANDTTKVFTISTFTDSIADDGEYFWLNLYRTYNDAADFNWFAYTSAYIADTVTADYLYAITSSTALGGPMGEGGAITFTITRNGSGTASTVYVSTTEGTAGNDDYQALDKLPVTFAAGETTKTVTVGTFSDSVTEGEEHFWLDLFRNYGDSVYATYGNATIADAAADDYSYAIETNSPVGEGDAVAFTITRNGSGTASTVYVSTYNGSAKDGDYQKLFALAVTFTAGETAKTVNVATYVDGASEGTEYFWFDLYRSYADAVAIDWFAYATATITDVAVDLYGYSVTSDAPLELPAGEGTPITFTITRSGTGSASTVYVGTEAGTASAAAGDYAELSVLAVSFAADETVKTVTIATHADVLVEHGEYFWLNLYATYDDALALNWFDYTAAYLADPAGAGAAAVAAGSVPEAERVAEVGVGMPDPSELLRGDSPAVSVASFPGHTSGAFANDYAFAAVAADGSVVTWGNGQNGGDSSAVASQLHDVAGIGSNAFAFAALRRDGSVIAWGNQNFGGNNASVASALDGRVDVVGLFSTATAFAALRADGSVVTWGAPGNGGDSAAVAGRLDGSIDVANIASTLSAFAALRVDGSVVTWGFAAQGGDSSAVAGELDGSVDVVSIAATGSAFAARRADGSVVTWGNANDGGNSTAVAAALNGTVDVLGIAATTSAFAAIRQDGSVIAWGDPNNGGNGTRVAAALGGAIDVVGLTATNTAFAALRADGSVVTWGDNGGGGSSTGAGAALDGTIDVTRIFAGSSAFAALRSDGSVVTWGDGSYGGESSAVAGELHDVVDIVATDQAFAALRSDGSVVFWGSFLGGGVDADVQAELDGSIDVVQLFATSTAFAALRADGSVVTWGDQQFGGNSDGVAARLASIVHLADGTPVDAVAAHDDAFVVIQGRSLAAVPSVLANDDRATTATLLAGPNHGTLQLAADGSLGYTPDAGFSGIDSFTYRAGAGAGVAAADAQALVYVVPVQVGAATLDLLALGAEQQVAATYAAFFGRGADAAGFAYWIGELDRGLPAQGPAGTLAGIAGAFAVSAEAKALHPFLADASRASDAEIARFLGSVYDSLFDRTPDASGLAYWTGQVQAALQAGQRVGALLVDIVSGARDTTAGNDIATLMGKVAVSLAYVREQDEHDTVWAGASDVAAATGLLHAVSNDPHSVLAGVKDAEMLIANHA